MRLEGTRLAYDQDPQREWLSLERGAQGRLEYLVTMQALRRHLPPPSPTTRILDADGGPGRYTIALASAGYRVTLLDLSPNLIALARELGRVLGPHGTLIVSAIGRFAVYRSAVQWLDWFDGGFPAVPDTGITTITSSFVPAYFFLPGEIEALLADAGMTVERTYGCQGIGAHLDEENLLTLMDDPVCWPQCKKVLLETCDHPAIVGVSSPVLVVARQASHRRRT